MPRTKSADSRLGKPITIRLPPDEEAYYRKMAAAHRMPLNGYLARTLVQGVAAENLHEFEERMGALIEKIPGTPGGSGGGIPEHLALSLITCEQLLMVMYEQQGQIALVRESQDRARAALNRRKGSE